MQQRLAVASILVLVLLAGASAVLIAHNTYGQNSPNASNQNQNQSNHDSSNTSGSSSGANSTTTSTSGGSLLTTANHTMSGDDVNETETETETSINSTLDS